MASLKLNHIYKVYPNGVKAVNDFTMDIDDKEFIVFVGPSGCGKSTTLRMIAGLEEITAGELRIGDIIVNDMEPKDRDIAMVFQNYALYPHMTVYENMAFGLKLRKMPKDEIDKRVKEAAHILGITEYLDRKPKAMSGGQRQRVALGRAIVREPKVFLLDEPLSNLDAKLRTAMRSEISKLHHKLQTTFIYVTHDQVEAMTMGTRIVVMKDGFIQQIDSPRNLYRFPCNKFVAGFIGTPQMNFFNGKLLLKGDKVKVTFDNTDVSVDAPFKYFTKTKMSYLNGEKPVVIGLRAEHISVDPNKYPYQATCRVSHTEELGTDCQVYADFNTQSEETVSESPTRVIVKAPAGSAYDIDEIITVSLDISQIQLFDAETEDTIAPRIPEETFLPCAVKKGKINILGAEIVLPQAIALPDGQYDVAIPTKAVSTDGTIAAKFISEENVTGNRLIEVLLKDRILFAVEPDKEKAFAADKPVQIGFDLKMISVYTKDGQQIVQPLNTDNALAGKVSKHKIEVEREVEKKTLQPVVDAEGNPVLDQNGKPMKEEVVVSTQMKKVKDLSFTLDIAGQSFDCPRATAVRLVNGGGQDIFNKELEFRFSPYQTGPAEQGIAAAVVKILDYGSERFAECLVGEKTIYVSVDKDFDAKEVFLGLAIDELAIYETARGIRLV